MYIGIDFPEWLFRELILQTCRPALSTLAIVSLSFAYAYTRLSFL
ncbi:hypothetical protein KsCSTR_12330 [Candidatus Kuenenia stuttgartiensis]|uniref:Uncharacterized protein n=1 Tax=Kuenenia stuttgartiensis TaxID=174633 RepID=A0A6G7GML8_KUEST|nr:hypothetical protein KsCSTR_12330 [Candidatus Kuenenia stuttgartiensis]